MNKLSENLKKIRKDHNLSQEQLSELLGVSRQAISKWESSAAYPEMDKVIQICNEFNLNIDDLLNKDIRECKNQEKQKNNINKYIDDFLNFVTNSINMFFRMTFKSKIKFIIEEIFIFGILLIIFLTLGVFLNEIIIEPLYSVFGSKIYYAFVNLLESIYLLICFILSFVIIIHIFKIRYLNYYIDEINNKNTYEEDNEVETKHKKVELKKEDKIIIRDPSHSEYRFINGMLKFIMKIFKIFTFMISMLFCFSLVFFVLLFILSFLIIKSGLLFIGCIIMSLGLIAINVIVLLVLFNFIFNRLSDKKKMIYSFISSIIIFSLGFGISLVGLLNFNYIDDKIETKLIETSLKMDKNYIIHNTLNNEIEFIEDNTLIDTIKIEYEVNELYNARYEIVENNVYNWTYESNVFEILRKVIKYINNKEINSLDLYLKVKVYSSKENIEILKVNKEKYEQKMNDYYNNHN